MRLFLLVFFLIYGLVHLYAFVKVKSALSFGPGISALILSFMTVMVLSPVIVHFAERAGLESFARFMSYTGFIWMGVLFIFISVSSFIDLYRLIVWLTGFATSSNLSFLRPTARASFIISSLLAVTINIYGYFEARDIRTESIIINTTKIPKDTGSFKIVQISDVHLGLIVRQDRLRRIVEIVKNANPDILVSTGDLIDGQVNKLEGLAELLQEINPAYGKYAVTGNHEYYAGLNQALSFIKKAGFSILRGRAVDIGGIINLAGVDDRTGKRFGLFTDVSEKDILSALDKSKYTILMKHRPRSDKEALGLYDLQVSGHTHKGQIFPFSLITKIYFRKDAGLVHLLNNSSLYINRGTGTWGPPVRFLSPPEITVIELVHEDKK